MCQFSSWCHHHTLHHCPPLHPVKMQYFVIFNNVGNYTRMKQNNQLFSGVSYLGRQSLGPNLLFYMCSIPCKIFWKFNISSDFAHFLSTHWHSGQSEEIFSKSSSHIFMNVVNHRLKLQKSVNQAGEWILLIKQETCTKNLH